MLVMFVQVQERRLLLGSHCHFRNPTDSPGNVNKNPDYSFLWQWQGFETGALIVTPYSTSIYDLGLLGLRACDAVSAARLFCSPIALVSLTS